jgi:putative protease
MEYFKKEGCSMKPSIITYLDDEKFLDSIKGAGINDIILEPIGLARMGRLNKEKLISLALACYEFGITPLLQWDILMTEEGFKKAVTFFKELPLHLFKAVRVQDSGAAHYIRTHFPDIKIHLILETGHHNWEGIQGWMDYLGDQLERVVLSLELSKGVLKKYLKKIPCETEILGIGRILLFYTPRNLVSPHFEMPEEFYEIKASSEETPHKNFSIVENRHGTFMFHPKGHDLLGDRNELGEMGLDFLRLDFKHADQTLIFEKLKTCLPSNLEDIKEYFSQKFIKGFFKANKSDVLFKKLKNHRIQRKDEDYLGDVVEVVKKKHIAIHLKNPKISLSAQDLIEFRTPEGKIKDQRVGFLKNALLEDLSLGQSGQIVFVPHLGSISVRTAVYKK